jgi:hypothetical protein
MTRLPSSVNVYPPLVVKEGTTEWVGLHLYTICSHVGCDDSSKGMHTTKHFVNTGHPVIVALPDKPWKWCYIDKLYG